VHRPRRPDGRRLRRQRALGDRDERRSRVRVEGPRDGRRLDRRPRGRAGRIARRIRRPSLYVGSRDDGYTTFGRDTRQFHQVTPAKVNRMLLVPGVDLLSDENGPRVRRTIVAFLEANAR
jgi:hypothetical protein